jgi:hypothetical protein
VIPACSPIINSERQGNRPVSALLAFNMTSLFDLTLHPYNGAVKNRKTVKYETPDDAGGCMNET